MEAIFAIIYGIAFLAIIYYMIQLKPMVFDKPDTPNTEPRSWPWKITEYSFWKEWMNPKEEYDTKKELRQYQGNQHGGGYGYTGREDAIKMKSFEGDHYGWDLDGGNYCGSGYGYTGRN